jgi:hypothetical protein
MEKCSGFCTQGSLLILILLRFILLTFLWLRRRKIRFFLVLRILIVFIIFQIIPRLNYSNPCLNIRDRYLTFMFLRVFIHSIFIGGFSYIRIHFLTTSCSSLFEYPSWYSRSCVADFPIVLTPKTWFSSAKLFLLIYFGY